MSKRSFDYKKKMNNKKKLHSKQVRKILMSSAVASTLVFQPFIPIIQNGQLIGFTESSASAATLAEVGLLTNEVLTVNQDTVNPYNFSATLTGTGLASVELVDPETVAVFSAPDLAGDLRVNGPATVTVQLLPITLNELPAVTGLLSGTIGTLTGVLDGILGGLGLVGGLDELNAALAALGNLDDALVEFTDYSATVPAIANDDGTITVDFTEGLGDQLRPAVNNVVLQLLEDVETAANSLTVLGLPIGSTVIAPLLNALNSITTPILNGTTDLLSGLTTAQVLGQTTISVNASVDETTTASGEIPISGAVVGTSVIDAELLQTLETEGSILLPAVDTEAPAAPIVTPVGEGATEVTGTAEAGSTVNVVFPGDVSGTTTAGADGTFTVAVPGGIELIVGDELNVTATDEAGNTSAATLVTVRDLVAPEAPTVDPVGDNATEITGTAEANSTVEVTFPGGITGTTTAGADGTFTVDVPEEVELVAGNQITVTATDAAENESDPATVIVTDETAPDAPEIDLLDNTATEVTGTAEPGSTVTVTFPDGEVVNITADGEGNFSVDIPGEVELAVGDIVSAVATDAAGNNSDPATITVTEVDETAPDAPTVNDVGENDTEVTGTAEPGSEITVTLPGGETATGTTDGDGNFVVTLPEGTELVAGTDLEVTATDATGNESDSTIVTVGDETAPAAPTVNEVGDNATEVTGTAEAGSEITVTLPDGETATGVTDEEGNFSVTLPEETELSAGDELTVISRDEAGNTSNPTTVTVTDTTAPEAPTVDEVGDNATEITGDAEPGSNITVTLPGGETATGVTDEDGNFTVTLPEGTELSAGEELTVIATDAAGNPSDAAIVTVVDTTAPAAPTVTPVDSTSTEVTGTAEPNSTITITLPDGTELTGAASETGAFAIELPEDLVLEGGERLLVTATDAADNESAPRVVTVADATAPIISPIDDATVVEGLPIDPIAVEVSEESTTDPAGLPEGLTYDADTGFITGSLSIDEWGDTEEEREFIVSVTATDDAGNVSAPEEFVLTVQRDTDGDDIPDVDDTDDDNDGVSDEDEIEAGTDPKDETDVPEDIDPDITAPTITEIDDILAVEGEQIEEIEVETDDPNSVITVDGLPNGLTFNEDTDTISGAPTLEDWGAEEEERTVEVSVTARDHSGNESEAEVFDITIQRDTDGDGTPDVEDEDDDNDGFTDEEEIEAGTDPKDDTDRPDVVAPNAPNIDGVTSEDTTVDGTAEPGSEVIVTLPNGDTVSGVTDEDGNFSVALPEDLDLTGGEVLEIVARDEAGNVSDPTIITVADRTAPIILEIDNQRIVEGTEIDEVNIVVENPGAEEPDLAAQTFAIFAIQPFATPLDGVFVQNLPEGTTFDAEENIISGIPVISDWGATEEERDIDVTVVARDEAGNEATETFTITVLRDTDGDGIPDIDDEDDDNDGATDEEEIDAGTDPKDDTDVPEDGEEADTTAPDAPTVEPVTDESTEVVGEAEPNTDVTITLPNGDAITGRTDEDGNFVITLPEDLELEVGDELVIVVTDEAGNSSEPLVVEVVDGSTPETPVDPEDPDNDGNTPGDGQDNGSTDGNNGNDGDGQNNGNGSSTGGKQGDDSASGNDEESLPQTGESQNVLTVISGSIMSAVGAMMLAWNKRKKEFTKRK